METPWRYRAFVITLMAVYFSWVVIGLAVSLGIPPDEGISPGMARFLTGFDTRGYRIHLGWDLLIVGAVAPMLIVGRRLLSGRSQSVPLWVDLVGAAAGVLVALGCVFYVALVYHDRMPSFGPSALGLQRP